ncbi:MAG: GNAT family N-acetyltransferase [Fidelibacterota bacterium]
MKLKLGNYMIRDWQDEDIPSLTKYANNRKIWLNVRDAFPYPYTSVDARRFLSTVKQQDPTTVFAIATEKESIGCIGLVLGSDIHRFTAEMGYWLAEPFWNQGIMTAAIVSFTEFAFKHYQLNRIFAEPYTNNAASARILEKAGFTCEAVMKAHAFKDGKILDMYLFAKTKLDKP